MCFNQLVVLLVCVANYPYYYILCSVDRASRYNRVKKYELDAQIILSIFHQPLHVSGVSKPIIRRYNCMYATFGTYCTVCCPCWIVPNQPGQQTDI